MIVPASIPVYKMPLPGTPSLFLLYQGLITSKAQSKCLLSSWSFQYVVEKGFVMKQANLGLSPRHIS